MLSKSGKFAITQMQAFSVFGKLLVTQAAAESPQEFYFACNFRFFDYFLKLQKNGFLCTMSEQDSTCVFIYPLMNVGA